MVVDDQPAAELGVDDNGLVLAHRQALGTPQTQVGRRPGLARGLIQDDGLAGAGGQALAALLGALGQVVGNQPDLLAAPVLLPVGDRRTGQEAPALIHVDLGEKRRQPLVVRHDGLDLAVVAQGHRRHRAEMGADFAHQTEAGVDADVQTVVAGDNDDGVPRADPGADVAFQAQNLVQTQLHRIDK